MKAIFHKIGYLKVMAVLLIAIGVIAVVGSTESPSDASLKRIRQAQRQDFRLIPLPVNQLPAYRFRPNLVDSLIAPFDTDSVEMFEYRGVATYHPVYIAQRCKEFLAAYEARGYLTYIQRADKYVRKLFSKANHQGNACYFAYQFNFAVHSDSANLFTAPWYSGMAQGEVLEVLSRLYEVTGDSTYLDSARSVFNTFLRLRGDFEPWVVRLDTAGYYWIEEYPHVDRPGRTLNGFIYALYGIYDYYRVSGDPDAKLIYDLCLTTITHYLPYYRREGQTSYYCLGHKHPATEGYHQLHINMMFTLGKMTGEPIFTVMRDVFKADVAKPDSTN